MKKSLNKEFLKQIFFYGIIGGGSALLDFLIFTLLFKNTQMNEFLANTISVHAGIAMSFILNRKYNFKKTDRVLFRAISFYLTGLFGLLLSEIILFFGNNLKFTVIGIKLVSIFIVAIVQFVINKLVAFRK